MSLVRRFWIAAVCTLGLFAFSATGVQAQAMKLLPPDTEMVITFNVHQILNSEAVKSNEGLLKLLKGQIDKQLEDKGVAKYLEKANFDLLKDLGSVTIAVPSGKEAKEGLIIIEGKFDAVKIEAAAAEAVKEAGGTFAAKNISGVSAFEITPKDEKTMYVGIFNKKTLIACSTKADFIGTVARLNGEAQAGYKSASFKNLLSTVNAKQSLSIVATSAIMGKVAEKAPEGAGEQVKELTAAIKDIEGFSAAITIAKNIDFQVGANTKDPKIAAAYAEAAKQGITFGKTQIANQAKQDEKLAPVVDVLNSLSVTTTGNNLMVRGQVTFEALSKLLANLPIPQQN